jgi:organic hydroperoxide reductase OsmC/OhrA
MLPRTPEYAPAPRREQARWGGESEAEALALYESRAESLRPAFLLTVAFALCFSLALRGSAQRANHRLAKKEIVVVLSSASAVLVDSSVAVVD